MIHYNKCPICDSEKTGFNFDTVDYFVSQEIFRIFKCQSCGFLFTQDHPEESEIGPYYDSDKYISHSDISNGFLNYTYGWARKIMLFRKKNIIHKITGLNSGTLLDIGSGTGYFAHQMKKSGWNVRGIEINKKARHFSKSHFGLEAEPPVMISKSESDIYDCITLWHVLEHLHDPHYYLSEIYRLLKPGAICIVALPNSSSYDAKHYAHYWAAWDVPRHLWHFNPNTFRLISENKGFTLERLRVLPLDVFYISQLSEKYKGSTLAFIKGLVKALFFTIISVFNKQKSSSIIFVLRKNDFNRSSV